jgi:D-alanyl-D-alanine carboxypeptidase/D-alanyl-D-alanine-endopeptidase (penicillin-binding protein 4)
MCGRMTRTAALVFAAALLAPPAWAADVRPEALRKGLDAIAARPALQSAYVGIEVRSLKSGKVLYAHDAGKSLRPASTLKLVTTAAALDAFGPDERLRTTVETAGRLDGMGRVLGDVYLVGGGDPNLSGRFTQGRITAAFESLADQLRAAGVRRIEGRLVGHEGLFGGDRRGDDWGWGDLVWWYGAEVSALSFNDNCADLTATPGEREGDPVAVDRAPASAYYRVVSTAVTGARGSASTFTLHRDLGSNVIRLSGALPLGSPVWTGSVALEDPARYAATVFREVLEAKGIVVSGEVATSAAPLPDGRRALAVRESEPFREILKAVNKPSQNLHAEMLLRLLGARRKSSGTVEAGQAAVDDFLHRLGVGSDHWSLQDGSGLSRSDLVTPHDMVTLLAAMDRHPHAAAFRDSLPVAGVDGTLRNRMKGSPAEGRVLAKTGTLRYVNALAGYVTTRGGERLAFYAVVNNHTTAGSQAVGALDDVARLLAGL